MDYNIKTVKMMKNVNITWTRLPQGTNLKTDPQSMMNEMWAQFNFRELWCNGNAKSDKRFLGLITYDEKKIAQKVFDRMMNNMSLFSFVEISEDYRDQLMTEWYPDGNYELQDDGDYKNTTPVEDL